jgi:predicted PurR-regulated permease PerM
MRLIVLILAYFFAADETLGEQLLPSVIPLPHPSHLSIVLIRLRDRITRWVWAQVTIALYFALTFGLGLVWLGVPFALNIALVGGVLEIIPYIGDFIFGMVTAGSSRHANDGPSKAWKNEP